MYSISQMFRSPSSSSFHSFKPAIVLAGVLSLSALAPAQAKTAVVPDAQVEANVLKALAGASTLTNESVTTNTVYGTVTLSGTVHDEAARTLAENLAARANGVKKVIDELTIGTSVVVQQDPAVAQSNDGQNAQTGSVAQADQANDQGGTNPNLQSDGTMAPPASAPQGPAPIQQGQPQQGQPQQQPPYPQQAGQYPPQYTPQSGDPNQQGGYPSRPQYRRPYAPPPMQQAYADQPGGKSVVVPNGALLRVRVNQPLSSHNSQPGTVFDGTIVSDVVADGAIAIPRGASVQGKVVAAQSSGAIKGRGELSLQLTQVTLGGQTYPVVSDIWARNGADKAVSTVNNAVGLGAMGAIIGAVAGGGAGAAIGAGVGGAAGVGASAASGKGQVYLPAESLLTFHLTEQVAVTTVSTAEMQRLAYGAPAGGQLQRRPPPPPPPYYVGPVYYPQYYRYYAAPY